MTAPNVFTFSGKSKLPSPKLKYTIYLYDGGLSLCFNDKGLLHRDDGLPAFEDPKTNYKGYYKNNQHHRVGDFPAVECGDGSLQYWENGKLHRLNGPAIIYPDGHRAYYQNGKRHNLNGPAVIYAIGMVEYWIDGVYYSKTDFDKQVELIKEKE